MEHNHNDTFRHAPTTLRSNEAVFDMRGLASGRSGGKASAGSEKATHGVAKDAHLDDMHQRHIAVSIARVGAVAEATRREEQRQNADSNSGASSPRNSNAASPRGSRRMRPPGLPRKAKATGASPRGVQARPPARGKGRPELTKIDLAPPASRAASATERPEANERMQHIMARLQRLQLHEATAGHRSGPPSPRGVFDATGAAPWPASAADENYTSTAASSANDRLGRVAMRAPTLSRPGTAGRIGSASSPDHRMLHLRRSSASPGRQLLRRPSLDAGSAGRGFILG